MRSKIDQKPTKQPKTQKNTIRDTSLHSIEEVDQVLNKEMDMVSRTTANMFLDLQGRWEPSIRALTTVGYRFCLNVRSGEESANASSLRIQQSTRLLDSGA